MIPTNTLKNLIFKSSYSAFALPFNGCRGLVKKQSVVFPVVFISLFLLSVMDAIAQPCNSPVPPTTGSCPPLTVSDTCNYYNHQSGAATAQTPCQVSVPHYCLTDADFTNGVWTSPPLSSPNAIVRNGYCCGGASSDRCVNFIFCVTTKICAVDFDIIDGAIPPGALEYKIDCGPPVSFLPHSPNFGCVSGIGTHTITFCKPGNNANQYRIRLVSCPTPMQDDSVRVGCSDTLIFAGVRNQGITWNSVFPGAPGQYNSYLNFTSGHDTVIVTPTTPLPSPPYVDYAVQGYASASRCMTDTLFCDTVRVYLFPALNTSLGNTAKFCSGQGGVNICAGPSGGVPPYTYQWYSPPGTPIVGATSNCYFATSAGTYVVLVNDMLSEPGDCGPADDTVTVSLDAINIVQSHTNVTCFGLCNGTITLVSTGGTPPYTYNWSNIPGNPPPGPSEPQNRDTLCAGVYTVTVTDNGGGCVGTFPITITQPPALAIVFDSLKNVGCNGEATGAIYMHVTGGTLPCVTSYQWSSGQATEDIVNVVAGTYCVTVTDCNGCTASACTTIAQPGAIVPLITSVLIDTVNNVSCWGAMDDTSCVSVTGGTPPYTYNWTPSGLTSLCVTAQGGGTVICVTVTDANGCVGNACHLITQPDSLYLLLNSVSLYSCGNISCFGLSDGAIDIQTNGGTPPFCYDWSDLPDTCPTFDEGEDRLNIPAGIYTVTVTDAHGCTDTLTVTLTEPPLLAVSLSSPVYGGGYNIPCQGQSTGAFTATPSGGCPPFAYVWNDIGPGPPIRSGLPAGYYCVTVTDANGCTSSACDSLTEPVSVVALINILVINPGNPISCFGECDGSAFATVTGGSPPYTYNWYQPDTLNPPPIGIADTVIGLCANSLILVVFDTNGCFAIDTAQITEPPLLTATVSVDIYIGGWNVSCNGACDGSATAIPSGGMPGYSYSWNTIPVQTTATATGLCAGTYQVVVTDTNGCDTTVTITLFEPPALSLSLTPFVFPCGANVSCVGACDGSITSSVSGGTAPYSYVWSSAGCGNNPNCSNLCAGTYTLTVTDANNCTISATITLTQPPPLIIDSLWSDTCIGGWNICCFYDTTGCMYTLPAGGCPPYSYLWSNGATQPDVCGVVALTYTVTVTDANGCTVTGSITLTEPPQLTATIVVDTFTGAWNVSCATACDGVATVYPVGGTPPYSYQWSSSPLDTLQTDSNLCVGTYCVTVTDANGCDTVYCVTLTGPTPLGVTISNTSIACDTACTNTVTANPSGGTAPYTYQWTSSSNPVQCPTCQMNDSVCVATYTVLVTDVNGCTATASVTLNPSATSLTVTLTASNYNGWSVSCNGACDGSLTATVIGGNPPYTYTWSTAACGNSPNCNNLCAGTYTVTVTDVNGCSGTASYIITEPPLLTVSASAIPGPCNGDCLGQVIATPGGGTAPYTFVWSSGCLTASCDSLCPNVYTVTVTDANGCTATASVTLTEPPLLVIDSISLSTFNGWNVHCNGDCDGYATVYASGGTLPYQYLWSSGPLDTLQTDSNLCAGIYCVTVTDANGCTATACDTLFEPPALSVSAVVVNDSCFNLCHGAINVTVSGGTPSYNYDWSDIPGASDPEDRDTLCDGTYTLTITDLNGCDTTLSFTITEPPLLTVTGTVVIDSCYHECQGEINITVTGGTTAYSFLWSNGSTTEDQDSLCAGVYTVTVTDAMGCTAILTDTVNEPPQLNDSIVAAILRPPIYNTSCPQACDGSATVYPYGGTPPYSIQWLPPLNATTAFVDSLCGDTVPPGRAYVVTITDANGCSVTDTLFILAPNTPISVIVSNDTNICNNVISITALPANAPYTGHWEVTSGCGNISDTLNPVIFVTGLCWGTNCFSWVVADSICEARDIICIQATAPVSAAAGSYPNFCEGDEPIHLNADTAYVGVGTWYAIGADSLHPSQIIFGNANDPNTFAWNFGWGTNTLLWVVVDGPCRDSSKVLIEKLIPEKCDTCLEMPTAFSPNQDGDNDLFVIKCIEFSYNRDNELLIFNRWGNIVYRKDDYLNEWYGQNEDGGLLPDGTYFAILTIKSQGINQGKVLKGYIDLRR
jgi:gliding motility-associated-like protein